jgi:DNA-directed RNA polymerase specialized sigma24 family protein
VAVSDDILERARKLNREAAQVVLTESYTAVWRLSHAIVGKQAAARKVVDKVLQTSLKVMPKWRPALAPTNWFHHHTLLNSRLAADPPPPLKEDLLVTNAADPTPQYLAFVGALRKLPIQQREALILSHGEKMSERQLGVAMDNSTTAAANHLRAAKQSLDEVTGGDCKPLLEQMAVAYEKLGPSESTVVPYIRRQIENAIWRRRMRRLIRRLFILALLSALAYEAWLNREQLIQTYHSIVDWYKAYWK